MSPVFDIPLCPAALSSRYVSRKFAEPKPSSLLIKILIACDEDAISTAAPAAKNPERRIMA
jgi:hypothetical protein